MAKLQRAWRARLLLAAAPMLLAGSLAAGSAHAIDRVKTEARWPSGSPLVTPYADTVAGLVLLHLQPRDGGGAEQLIDARTGRRWTGAPGEVMTRFTRLPVEAAGDVQAGRAWDQRLAHALGCTPPVTWCTSPADADLVLFLRADGGRLRLETVDLRGLFGRMDELMAGRIEAAAVTRHERDWQLIELAAAAPARRQRWLDALRSIDSAERWRRVKSAAEQGPRLLQWASMGAGNERAGAPGIDAGLDLAGELERAALRLLVERLARAAVATGTLRAEGTALGELADGLLLASQPGFRGDLPSALVDVLLQLDPAERAPLAARLATEAERRRSHGLWCYAEWMSLRPCRGTPVWEATPAPPAPTPTPPPAPTPPPPAAPPGQAAPPAGRPPGPDGDAPQEWALLRALPSKLMLLSYEETSGNLAPDTGAAAGLSFVARSLGPVQDGRFELQVSPNARAPLQLRHGAYRVRVRLVLDYAREDRCRSGLLCLFAGSERHARTERRDLVFTLAPGNRFAERRRAEFGHLLPLAAGGSLRYESTLTQARLAVEAVHFELL